jgi:stage II sporulation protein M
MLKLISYQDNREWIKTVSKIFLVALALGALAYLTKPELLEQVLGVFKDKFGSEIPVRDAGFAKEIFLQNSLACLLALVGGIVFGISSTLIVFLNGFIIGFVIMVLLTIPGSPFRNLEYIILGLVPHGIFEIPAFLLASALGLRLGTEWLRQESAGHRWQVVKQNALRVVSSMPVLAIMLLIAAFIEVFVSGSLVDNFK